VCFKRIQKSYSPTLTTKSLVPFKQRVPFMCQLLKYYESENTIYLLLGYHPLGKLYPYLSVIEANMHRYPDILSSLIAKDQRMSSIINQRRFSIETPLASASLDKKLKASNSYSCLPDQTFKGKSARCSSTSTWTAENDKRRSQSQSHSLEKTETTNLERLVESPLPPSVVISPSQSISSPSSSSSSSSASSLSPSAERVVVFSTSSALFCLPQQSSQRTISETISEPQTSQDSTYLAQVKKWLAQLLCALKSLHSMGIIVKDLNENNILIDVDGQLRLSFISKWHLVDEKLSHEAIKNFYTAPGKRSQKIKQRSIILSY
jgi:hypothetical protein